MAATRFAWARGGTATLTAFFLLCFLLALGAMRSDLFPDQSASLVPQMQREAVTFALMALVAALFSLARRAKWPRSRQLWNSVVIGLGLFAAPAVLVYLSREWISSLTRVALISLVPLFAVVFEPYIGAASAHSRTGLSKTSLPGALVAVLGSLCIFPVAVPSSIQTGAAFAAVIVAAACVAAANCYAVRVACESPPIALAPMAAVACAASAVSLVAATALTSGLVLQGNAIVTHLGWSAAISLPGFCLLFWLMPRMSAPRMTTRFVFAPLVAILFSTVLDQPSGGLQIYLGILLIAAGAGWLLFAPEEEPDAGSSLHL